MGLERGPEVLVLEVMEDLGGKCGDGCWWGGGGC